MKWTYDDGGRSRYFKGTAGDCVCRAISIAAEMDYKQVYDLLNAYGARERKSKRQGAKSSARDGMRPATTRKVLDDLGWTWVPTMQIGSGCKTHLSADELPGGRIIARTSGHLVAVVDGVVHDTHDPSRDGTRCVYGYWTKPGAEEIARRRG